MSQPARSGIYGPLEQQTSFLRLLFQEIELIAQLRNFTCALDWKHIIFIILSHFNIACQIYTFT